MEPQYGNHTFETSSLDAPVKITFAYVLEDGTYLIDSYDRLPNGYSLFDVPREFDKWMREEIELFLVEKCGAHYNQITFKETIKA